MRNQSRHISKKPDRALSNQRGQGLIEYLIIVALMGVATIAIIRTMGHAVSSKFATISHQLQGDNKSFRARVDKGAYKKRDMGTFFQGAATADEPGNDGEDKPQ